MKKQILLILCAVLMSISTVQVNASTGKNIFKTGLEKARKLMQSAFQMTFLPSVPVLVHKDHFNTMFDYAKKSIDKMDREHNGERITRDQFQDDKALHIKKSAELALHIQSLIGSAHLAYGITLAIGLIKEAIDSSFLNPHGSRDIKDFYADKVGASAVFGKKKFDKKLDKYMDYLVKEKPSKSPTDTNINDTPEVSTTSPFGTEKVTIKQQPRQDTGASSQRREMLMKEYYEAVNNGNTEKVKTIGKLLQAQ